MKANRSTNKQHVDQLYIIYTINNIKSTSALTCYRRAEQIWKTIIWKVSIIMDHCYSAKTDNGPIASGPTSQQTRDSSNLTIWEGWSFLTWLVLCAATLMSTQSIEVTSSPHSLDTDRCLHHIVMSQPSTLNNSVLLTVEAVKRWSTVWSQLTEMTQVCLNCFFAIHCRVESLTESSLCKCSSPRSEGAMNIDRRFP